MSNEFVNKVYKVLNPVVDNWVDFNLYILNFLNKYAEMEKAEVEVVD